MTSENPPQAASAATSDPKVKHAPVASAKSVYWAAFLKGDKAFEALLDSIRRR